ncbi:hypothetical protein ABID21_001937 [Pseudorhizobium tarimense]|uniref:YD repeat-containing protein n=1 Tax=Pseudorhizobium tarimense TaxID=1079109 RepID=A0ABV2H5L7_9HYPH|nr:hypothetical protein [Pseudorhizobium tarimense]MCJ8519029.1 hypothetical protein [Pseudorhizobium tarimense]
MATSYYSTGTVSLANGSAVVTGNGTLWQSALIEGGNVIVEADGNNVLPIASVDSETQITAELKWRGTSGTYSYAIQRDTAYLKTLDRNSQAVSYLLDEIRKGTIFKYDASGTLAERVSYDAQPKGFSYLVLEGDVAQLYVKGSNTSGDWDGPFDYGVGPVGPAPSLGIGTVTTREPGQSATAGVNGGGGSYTLDLGIPSGLTGMTHRGIYSSSTAYVERDAVLQAGSTWIAKVATTGNAPPGLPTTENTWWRLVAAKGTDGQGAGDMVKATYDPTNKQADAFDGANHAYSNTTSKLLATTVQSAIDELVAKGELPTPSLDLLFTDTEAIDPSWFTRASTGTYLDATGRLRTAAVNQPRIHYDFLTGRYGILVEEARTNLVTYSGDQMNDAYALAGGATKQATSVTASYGTETFTKIVAPVASNSPIIQRYFSSTEIPNSTECWFTTFITNGEYKRALVQQNNFASWDTRTSVVVDTVTGEYWVTGANGPDAVVEYCGNGIYRVAIRGVTNTAGGTRSFSVGPVLDAMTAGGSFAGDGVSGILNWGWDVEIGTCHTSYIPTTAAAVSRAVETPLIGNGDWLSATEGMILVEGRQFGTSSLAPRAWQLRNGSDALEAQINGGGGVATAGSYVGGSYEVNMSQPLAKGIAFKHAFAWKLNDFAFSLNGSTAVLDTSGAVPNLGSGSLLYLGRDSGTARLFNGVIYRLAYCPIRVPNQLLPLISS